MTAAADQLVRDAAQMEIDLSPDAARRLVAYRDLLVRWNRRFNLTAIREPQAMLAGHLLDALSIVPLLNGRRVADVGTGAGIPGIVLAVVCPERQVVMIDANGKKTRFVREALRSIAVDNAGVVQARVEDYRPESGFDTVVCRAFAPLPRIVELAGHLCNRDGAIVAQKGLYPAAELDELPPEWAAHSQELRVPGLDKARHAITLRRHEAT